MSSVIREEKTLVQMVGISGSGKSTFARKLSDIVKGIVVCPDNIRLALHGLDYCPTAEPMIWAIADNMVKTFFIDHDVIVLDATGVRTTYRDVWAKPWKRVIVYMDTPLNICLKRQKTRDYSIYKLNKESIKKKRKIMLETSKKMFNSMEVPSIRELRSKDDKIFKVSVIDAKVKLQEIAYYLSHPGKEVHAKKTT